MRADGATVIEGHQALALDAHIPIGVDEGESLQRKRGGLMWNPEQLGQNSFLGQKQKQLLGADPTAIKLRLNFRPRDLQQTGGTGTRK